MVRTVSNWQEKDEAKLIQLYNDGLKLREICEQLDRSKDSVVHRIKLLKARLEVKRRIYKPDMQTAYYNTVLQEISKFENKKSKYSKLSKVNHDVLLEYDKRNRNDDLTPSTRAGKLSDITTIANHINKSFSKIEVSDIENFWDFYKQKGNKITTKKGRIKEFYSYLSEKFPKDKNIMQVFLYLSRKKRSRKKKSLMDEAEHKDRLSKMEVVKLVASVKGNDFVSVRDRAVLASLYDTAARRSEIISVRVSDVKIDGNYPCIYLPESKTIPRNSPLLSFSLPYLMEYKKNHEFLDNPDAPFFYSGSTKNYGEALTDSMINMIVKRSARLAKITKTVSPHILRDSKIVHIAQDNAGNITAAEANDLFGWSRTSGMYNYYSKVSEKELKFRELERQGKLSKKEQEDREAEKKAFYTIICKRCGTDIKPDEYICSKCGLARNAIMSQAELDKDKEIGELKQQMANMEELLKPFMEQFIEARRKEGFFKKKSL